MDEDKKVKYPSSIREGSVYGSASESNTLRLNPALVKQKGLKLWVDDSSASYHSDVYNRTGLAPVDDSDLQKYKEALEIKVSSGTHGHKSSKRIFTGMFRVEGKSRSRLVRESDSLASRENYKMPPKKVEWWQVTLFLLNDINEAWFMFFAAMILGLYGWVLGIAMLVGLWPVSVYVTHLLWRCRNVFPGAVSIGDLVYYLSGSTWAMYITFFFVNLTIALTLAFNLNFVASSMYWLSSYTSKRCYIVFLAGACLILLPLTQLRTLHSLTIINVINLLCLLCFAAIYMYFLVSGGRDADAVTSVGPNVEAWKGYLLESKEDQIRGSPVVVVEIMVAAYHYQLLVLEIMAEMKDPREFPKANYWCTPFVLLLILSLACFRYYYQGAEENLTDIMPLDVISSAFDRNQVALAYFGMACFAIKMLGSCLIRSIILTRSIQLLIHPKLANMRTWRSRIEWSGISLTVLVLTFLLGISVLGVLSLVTFMGILSSICAMSLPVCLFIWCSVKQSKRIHWFEWLLMAAILALTLTMIVLYILKLGLNNTTLMEQQSNFTRTAFHVITDCPIL